MKELTVNDLDDLSLGSAVLGSGGGGDPSYAALMTRYLIEKYGPIQIITVDELQEDDLVVPLSQMGAPLINMERLPSGNELNILLQTIEDHLGRKPTVLMAAEIGGANAFTPLLAAAKLKLPVLDADMIGRAFPELQMSSCYLNNLESTPAVMVDCLGNRVIIETANAKTLEKIARSVTVSMGSSSAVGFYLMKGTEVPGSVVTGSLSKALRLGNAIRIAQEAGKDFIQALIQSANGVITQLVPYPLVEPGAQEGHMQGAEGHPKQAMPKAASPMQGNAADDLSFAPDQHKDRGQVGLIIGCGTLIDVNQEVKDGFLQGSVTLLCDKEKIQLFYQNEYLLAKKGSEVLASTPDIFVLLDENSGTPLTSEMLRYGLQVALIVLPAPEIWQTSEGLKLVGPKAFGYEIAYQPILQTVIGS